MSMTSEVWTDENIAKLKKLWDEGWSCSEIARQIANGCTRNAVIGKAHRMQLKGREPNKSPAQIAGRLKSALSVRSQLDQKRDRRGQRRTSPVNVKVVTRLAEPRQSNVSVIALNVALLDLAPSMCRWPTSYNGQHLFCGNPRCGDHSQYCAAHEAAAVNATLTAKVKKRARTYQKYMIGLTRFERQAA